MNMKEVKEIKIKENKIIIKHDQELLNQILISGIKELDIKLEEPEDKVANSFEIYKDNLLEYNLHTNLTAITDEKEVYIKHFLDSLSAVKAIEETIGLKKGATVIDVGTGAGFPSLPIKMVRKDIHLTLLDSLNKRIKFLQEVSEKMELQNTYVHSRAEDGGRDKKLRENFDIGVSRAVASLPVLLEYCIPYIKKGGYFVCLKGPQVEEEIVLAEKALKLLKCQVEKVIDVKIPHSDLNHKIVIIKKTEKTDKLYPRKAGTPSKEPLK